MMLGLSSLSLSGFTGLLGRQHQRATPHEASKKGHASARNQNDLYIVSVWWWKPPAKRKRITS